MIVQRVSKPLTYLSEMDFGNKPIDGGYLLMTRSEVEDLGLSKDQRRRFIRRIYGSAELIRGISRYCLWIKDADLDEARATPSIAERIEGVRQMRLASKDKGANAMAARAHQMREMNRALHHTIAVPRVSSEKREYLPVALLEVNEIVGDSAFALYDAPIWYLAIIASRLHWVWVNAVCGKLGSGFRYSNTLSWNTFPLPQLTQKQRTDLTHCAENILLAREAHFPATLAERSTTPRKACQTTSAPRTRPTTKPWSVSTSAAASKTIPNA